MTFLILVFYISVMSVVGVLWLKCLFWVDHFFVFCDPWAGFFLRRLWHTLSIASSSVTIYQLPSFSLRFLRKRDCCAPRAATISRAISRFLKRLASLYLCLCMERSLWKRILPVCAAMDSFRRRLVVCLRGEAWTNQLTLDCPSSATKDVKRACYDVRSCCCTICSICSDFIVLATLVSIAILWHVDTRE